MAAPQLGRQDHDAAAVEEIDLLARAHSQKHLRRASVQHPPVHDRLRPRRRLLRGEVPREAAGAGGRHGEHPDRRRAEAGADRGRLHEGVHDVRGADQMQRVGVELVGARNRT